MVKKIFVSIVFVIVGILMFIGIRDNQKGIYYSDGKKSILENLDYEVEILRDGSARVKEERTYEFVEGEFSRGYLDIQGFADEISVEEDGVSYARIDGFNDQRPEGKYAVGETGGNTRIEWYYRTDNNQKKTFTVYYKIHKAVKKYNDCADYFQKYLSSDNVYVIQNFSVLVKLPEGANSDNTKIWGHGPAGGKIEFSGNNTVELKMKNVPAKRYIEARFLMPVEAMGASVEKINQNNYEYLLNMENEASEKADKEAGKNSLIFVVSVLLSALGLVTPLFLLSLNKKKMKRLKPEIEPDYYRDLPADIFPAELDYLMNHYSGKKNVSVQISATLLDLINKGYVFGQLIENNGFIGKKKDMELVNKSSNWNELAVHEKALMEFLFVTVGLSTGKVLLSEVKKYCKNKGTSPYAYHFYNSFNKEVYNIANRRGYFEYERNKNAAFIGFYVFISLVLIVVPMLLYTNVDFFKGTKVFYVAIAGLGSLLMMIAFGKNQKPLLTQFGENQFALWRAFKKFIEDFTTFDKKELPELFMWEKYLVYATVLGSAEKLLKQLYAKYPELLEAKDTNRLFYMMSGRDYQTSFQAIDSIGSSFSDAIRDMLNNETKASKGDGGGFSSGGSDAGSGAGGSSGGVD